MPKRFARPSVTLVLAAASLVVPLGLSSACRAAAPAASGEPAEPAAAAAPTAAAARPTEAGPVVLASFTILADLARQVAGDRARVDSLLPVDADPHLFQPTAADLQRVQAADLIVVNGAGLEAGIGELLAGRPGARRVVATEGLNLHEAEDEEARHDDEAGHDGEGAHDGEAHDAADGQPDEHAVGHEHGPVDPHAWLDPRLAMAYVAAIADGLSSIDPAGAGSYAERSAAYQAQLADLDAELEALLAPIPDERRLLVTDHEALGYFAERYRLRVLGTIVPGYSTGAEPSAKALADLVDRLRAGGAPAIFLKAGTDRRLADQLAAESGVRVVDALYVESLSGPDGPAAGYLALMRHNAKVIAAALVPGSGAP